jgi:hypothetical protein
MPTYPAPQAPQGIPGTPQSPVVSGGKSVNIAPVLPNMSDPTASWINLGGGAPTVQK